MSSRDRVPIWAEPEPGARQPRFSREQIAAAALAIADTDGFDAVSMRRVAAELGAGTMTLYHYVRTKDDLVALMDDALMGEVVVPSGSLPRDWRAALTAIARRTRAVSVRHPWALLAMRGAGPGPNGMRHFEQCLAALEDTRLTTADRLEVIALVDDFVIGHVLRAGEARLRGRRTGASASAGTGKDAGKGEMDAIAGFLRQQLDTGDYPLIQALLGGADPRDAYEKIAATASEERRFERGLRALLDGVEGWMRPPRRGRSAPGAKRGRSPATGRRRRR